MARRSDGRPKRARHVNLSDDQFEALTVISARTLGQPTISSLIRVAIDEFVHRQVERDPAIAAELQNAQRRTDKVVPIRTVKADEQ